MGGKRPEKISEGLCLHQASRSTYIAFLGVPVPASWNLPAGGRCTFSKPRMTMGQALERRRRPCCDWGR